MTNSQDHFIGIDVGTGSARACLIDSTGEIKALATENIQLWRPESQGHYEQSTTDIWRSICLCVHKIVAESGVDPTTIRGIGFDATCSLAVFTHDTDEPVPVTGPDFANDGNNRNVILWLDHRPLAEAEAINKTGHNLLRYVGGTMSVEMEIPKVLWLKNNMPPELFDRCKFYDLADALTHMATGAETRSFCSAVCKQGYVPVGVDGSVKGWQEDFYHTIGLGDLVKDDFKRMGGVDGVSGAYLSAGELVGRLSEKAARELGLPAGIAIGSGVIDAYAGWIGTVGAKVQLDSSSLNEAEASNDISQAFTRLAAVAGTSTCHLAMSKEPVFVPGVWGPYRDVLLPGFWMAEGGQSATGELLKHILETHPAYSATLKEAEAAGKNIYDFLNDHLKHLAAKASAPSIPHLARHIFFYGDLWGNRSPVADPNMRGALIGMSPDTSRDAIALLYYATMEFIALQTRQIIETMNGAGHAIASIFMSGSQCQNEILMDLVATACDMPVLIPRYVHAAVVHGAAMLGAKAASDGEGLWSIMDRMSKPGRTVWPGGKAGEKKLLEAKYGVFLDQCRTQQEYRRKVDEAIRRSLFGQTNQQAQQPAQQAQQPATGGGLFGTAATNTAAKPFGGSLFGSTTQPQQQQQQQQSQNQGGLGLGSSLFGNKPSLLGGNTTTPQQGGGGGLFGGGATNNTTGGTGLFGATMQQNNNNNNAVAPGMGASILGGASTNTQANNTQATGAYFDSLAAKTKKQAEGEAALGDLPSLQLGLGDLRQRLKKLGPRAGAGTTAAQDGKAHYFLAASGVDPGAAVKDLGAFGAQIRADRPSSAAAGYGEVDVETYLSNLQTKTTLSMIADGLERSVRDFDSFLEDNVTLEWDAQRKRIYEHFGIKAREPEPGASRPAGGASVRDGQGGTGGFGRSRRKASQAPGGATQRQSVLGRSQMQRSVLGTPSRIGSHASEFTDVEPRKEASGNLKGAASSLDDRFLREKQGLLAEEIQHLNSARLQKQPIYLFRDLAEIESKSGDRHAPQIFDAYLGMMEVVQELPDQSPPPKERHFAKYYLDPNPQSDNSVQMRTQILTGARRFLESKFYDEITALIEKYPEDAHLGGRPDVVSKIKAYVRLKIARKNLVKDDTDLQSSNGEFVWAILFYLLRAGFVSEAAQYVNTNESQFRSIDRAFPGYINSYASSEDRRLKRQMQDRCANEYNQRIRNAPEGSIDPFRMACYKIVGRCDLANRTLDDKLSPDVYDWYWLQFALARESDRALELAGESFGLAELQASVREIGLKHFPKNPAEDTNSMFGMYFYLQLLAGLYEPAIAYLYQFSYVDAVHFAIALSYYGLLRPADAQSSGNELLSHNTRGMPQINFGRMLGYYTRDFRAANAAAAVDYLVLICLNADDTANGQQQAQLAHEALRELVLETREFSKLIGDIRPDGARIKGVVEERGPLIALGRESDFIRAITLQAAAFADENGRTTDAVLLFHLAGDFDTVISIVSRALSEAISLEIGEDPMRLIPVKPRAEGQEAAAQPGSSLSLAAIDDPVELARTMMTMYERDRMFWGKIQDHTRMACSVLLQMSEIKTLVEQGRWPECLDKIKALDILPLEANGDSNTIRHYASRFAGLTQPVAINVPNLIMWTVVCCTKQRERLLGGQFSGNESTARMMVDELKQMSIDLTSYTSQLKYRLPPHLHEALARASAA
ncbi:Nup93/Nic96-domain-containing protein [Podospora conica]|nr:Nup93/Nic96-domain-containing protein [Schizothecium conicum]